MRTIRGYSIFLACLFGIFISVISGADAGFSAADGPVNNLRTESLLTPKVCANHDCYYELAVDSSQPIAPVLRLALLSDETAIIGTWLPQQEQPLFDGMGNLNEGEFIPSQGDEDRYWQSIYMLAQAGTGPALAVPQVIRAPAVHHQNHDRGAEHILVTLQVRNIQVRAKWEVKNEGNNFTINALAGDSRQGVLRVGDNITLQAVDYVVTVLAIDEFSYLNGAYENLTAMAELTIVGVIGPLRDVGEVVLAVTLIEDVGDAAAYTFAVAGGIAPYSYTFMVSQGLSVDAASGVLSYSAGSAAPGVYVVTVSADDTDTSAVSAPIELLLTVEVSAALSAALSEGARNGVYSFVNLTAEVGKIMPSGGIGAYTFTLDSGNDDNGYFTINSSIGVISVKMAPESEAGNSYTLVWTLNDGDERSPEVTGTVSVQFIKMLSAENTLRYAVENVDYSETISIPVVGGVPDADTGYTFELANDSPTGYRLEAATGLTIILHAESVTVPTDGHVVTVIIHDSQDPRQSDTFVLEVSVVSALTFEPDSATAIEGIVEVIDLTPYAMGGNIGNADAESKLSFMVSPTTGGFKVGNDNMLTVAATVEAGDYEIPIVVEETNPAHEGQGIIIIGVAAALTASGYETVIVPVELKAQVIRIAPSGGIGDYIFTVVSDDSRGANDEEYLTIDNDGVISVQTAPVEYGENEREFKLVWSLNDGDPRSPEVFGTVSGHFTKSPGTLDKLRYVVENVDYSETISIPVVGGVPDAATGYTFALATDSRAGYRLEATNGLTITLHAEGVIPTDSHFVTVNIHDSQNQSGTFVLEVRVVPELTFSDATLTIFQTESAFFLSLVNGGNTQYPDAGNARRYLVISDNSDQFTAGSDGILMVGGAVELVGLNTVTVQVTDTVPPQTVTANLVISVLYKELPVTFDRANSNLPSSSIDPDYVPLSITLKATGGAQFPSYTFSISEGDEDWFSIEGGNVLVITTGAPVSGTHTFKVKVVDGNSINTDGNQEDEAEISFTFQKPPAQTDTSGNVEVSGSESSDGSYSSGETFTFDPKTEEGVTLVLGGASDTAVVTAENGQIRVTLNNFTQTDSGFAAFTPSSGTFVMLDGKKLAQAAKDGIDAGKVAISFGGGTDNLSFSYLEQIDEALAIKGGLLAIIAPAGLVNGDGVDIVSGVTYLLCNINGFGFILCELKEPTSTEVLSAGNALRYAIVSEPYSETIQQSFATADHYIGDQDRAATHQTMAHSVFADGDNGGQHF